MPPSLLTPSPPPEDMLQLSGIQHYMFCPRQWALIHIEQVWEDNRLTAEGTLLHSNVDNPRIRETNGSNIITLRRIYLSSPKLGFTGVADAVEIIPKEGAPAGKEALIKSRLFNIIPVEYKHGKSKANDCDRLQVTAQAMILEEMLHITILHGAIFYWQTRRREYFLITPLLREKVMKCSQEMHQLIQQGITPAPQKKPHCKSCSLIDLCIPTLGRHDVSSYLKSHLDEEAP